MALDIGEVRTGIALSDATRTLASPHAVLATREIMSDSHALKTIALNYDVGLLVCGLPLSLLGEKTSQTKQTEARALKIANDLDLPLHYQDERYSSKEARSFAQSLGYTDKQLRGSLDMFAAVLILEAYLDTQRAQNDKG